MFLFLKSTFETADLRWRGSLLIYKKCLVAVCTAPECNFGADPRAAVHSKAVQGDLGFWTKFAFSIQFGWNPGAELVVANIGGRAFCIGIAEWGPSAGVFVVAIGERVPIGSNPDVRLKYTSHIGGARLGR